MTDLTAMHATALATLAPSGLARRVTWPDGSTSLAVIQSRTETLIYETRISEPTWTMRAEPHPLAARGVQITRDDGKVFRLGERIGGSEYLDTWSLRPC